MAGGGVACVNSGRALEVLVENGRGDGVDGG
jgi:hypothetical protein